MWKKNGVCPSGFKASADVITVGSSRYQMKVGEVMTRVITEGEFLAVLGLTHQATARDRGLAVAKFIRKHRVLSALTYDLTGKEYVADIGFTIVNTYIYQSNADALPKPSSFEKLWGNGLMIYRRLEFSLKKEHLITSLKTLRQNAWANLQRRVKIQG